uniref:PAN/APPLE domain-containing protein n=1 Tax=Daphnia magna TaxID=35525 RepID=A0A0P5D8R1_9CRUS
MMFNLLTLTFSVIVSHRSCSSVPLDSTLSSAINISDFTVEPRQKACWELIVDGRRLDPQFIVRSVWAATLLDCQRECEDVLFNCETIAYGKNLLKNTTCDLSDWEAASLSVQPYATDTIVAPTFNVYSRYGRYPNEALDERRCNSFDDPAHHDTTPYYRPASTQIETLSEDVCYSVIFNGRRLSHRYIERSVAVISLDECKLLCTRETSFDCRSFNYRRRLSSTNCDLSREDSASLDVTSSRVFFTDPDVDFYQRVGRGQSCYRPFVRPPASPAPSSGSEYYYGSSNPGSIIQRPITSVQPSSVTTISECYRRLKSGYRLESRIVRDSLNVRNLYECQTECHRSRIFVCRSFSYRQAINGYNSGGGNNCELSDLDPREWDPVRHLVIDREADIYERSLVGRNCRDTPVTTWNNRPTKPSTLCFLRTKSGIRMDRRAIRHSVTANSPVECEQECINSQYFTCRSFSYRFTSTASLSELYHKVYENCDMSDIDLNSMDPLRDLIDDRGYDSWQRTSYSRDCDIGSYRLPDTSGDGYFNRDDEEHHFTSLNPWFYNNQRPYPLLTGSATATSRCYISYRRGFRMVQRLVRDSIHVRNLAECELECSRTRPFTCQTFHFRYTNLEGGYDRNPYNCELSDVSARDFDRYRDMTEDRDYELFTRSQFSSCVHSFNTLESASQLSPILASSSTEVTVSGIRCRDGSKCRPHRELGYWYCEIDNSYYKFNNNWDYCCQPQSRCGYSDGYTYPWCMVGSEASGQWRPCSDRYAERPYAYLHRTLPPNATETQGAFRPLKNDEDVIRPVDSNSADYLRSGSHIIVQTNCTESN